MQSSELQDSFLTSLALVAWNRRRTLLFVLAAASFTWDFIALSASIKWDASGACRFWHDNILPSYCKLTKQLSNVLDLLLQPLCLFIFLNLVLMTIVVKSGFLTRPEEANISPMFTSKMYQKRPSKASLDEFDVRRSGDSNRKKEGQIVAGQERDWSFFTMTRLEVDQSVVSYSTSCDLGGHQFSAAYASINPLLSMSVGIRATAAEKAAPLISNLPLLEGALRDVEKRRFLVGDDDAGGLLDEQLVQIEDIEDDIDEEMSADELYHRAEAYIRKVRRSWLLQNQPIKCTV